MTHQLILANDITEIRRLTPFIENFGEKHHLQKKTVCDLHLALEEIVSNIVHHGGGQPQKNRIDIQVRMEKKAVMVTIRDDTHPFNPINAKTPDLDAPLKDRDIGGLGIHLVRSIMDEMTYDFQEGKNVLSLKKYIDDHTPHH